MKKGGWIWLILTLILNRSKCHGSKDCLVQKHQIGKLYQENFNDVPEFYKEIINCWVEFGGGQTKTLTNFREIRNQNIWGNKYIKFNNKSLIYMRFAAPFVGYYDI